MTYRKPLKKLLNKLLKIIAVKLIENDRYIFRLLILLIFNPHPKIELPVIEILKQTRGHYMDMGMEGMDMDMDIHFHFWFQYRYFMMVLVWGVVWLWVGL